MHDVICLIVFVFKSCIKRATKQNQFKQNLLSKEKNNMCKDLTLAHYKLFIEENVIVPLRRQ